MTTPMTAIEQPAKKRAESGFPLPKKRTKSAVLIGASDTRIATLEAFV